MFANVLSKFSIVFLSFAKALHQIAKQIDNYTIKSRRNRMNRVVFSIKYIVIAIMFASFMFAFAESEENAEKNTISPVGTYAAKLPSASGMGRIAIIHLFENGNAMRTNIYIGKPEGDYVEDGKWKSKGETIEVILTVEQSRTVKKQKILKFKIDGENLIATQYDEKPFGKAQGIEFVRIPEVTPDEK